MGREEGERGGVEKKETIMYNWLCMIFEDGEEDVICTFARPYRVFSARRFQ